MMRRLWYGITWPSAIITLCAGTSLIIMQPEWLKQGFMHVKLTLVVLLYGYHFSLQYVYNLLSKDVVKYTSQQLRLWNEMATLFLVAIVFLIVLKNTLDAVSAVIALVLLIVLLLAAIKLYKRWRKD